MSYLQEYRKSKRLSRQELAEQFGCSPSLIAHCEKGIRRITADNAVKWERLTHGELSRKKLSPYHFSDV